MLSTGSSRDDRGVLKPVQLHVVHDLGGGIARWCADYCRADDRRINLVLKPYSRSAAMAEGLMLFAGAEDAEPLGFWLFESPIAATADTHPEYRRVLTEILHDFGVDAILVSSLIGHSLDVLDSGLLTVLVQHDFYPYCPAIHIYYNGVCQSCDAERLTRCAEHNPSFNPAHRFFPAEARLRVRERFIDLVERRNLTCVVPSRSARAHFNRLVPRIDPARFVTIPHGHLARLPHIPYPGSEAHDKLRVVVLGMLSVSKGVNLLLEGLEPLLEFAEVHLVGAREMGALFEGRPGVRIVSEYSLDDLPGILSAIRPDAALLLSVVPETFSYTLSELFMLGIPPVATNLGGFAERISPGVTGYLFEPGVEGMLSCLRDIHADREGLQRIRAQLLTIEMRSAKEMLADYHRLLPLPDGLNDPAWLHRKRASGSPEDVRIAQALALSGQWKEIRNLRATVEMKSARLDACIRETDDVRSRLADLEHALQETRQALALRDAEIIALHESTSWRATGPLRRGMILARCLRPVLRQPSDAPAWLRALSRAWRSDGIGGVKRALLQWPEHGQVAVRTEPLPVVEATAEPAEGNWLQQAFRHYRASMSDDIRAVIATRVQAMDSPPLISILVPTYNTPEPMLREMLDSVCAQLYPHWQLCIADDGSSEPHVRAVLEAHAARDARIRLDFATENGGVSRATNRALVMAEGDFVVLLDHDDMLEEQALFRVAEAVLADDPDMLYSDEVLVGEDGKTVQHFIFRPMFSPEYLRSHPYIVHLIGFRPSLLRALGGLDENLRISQDYDLILRASERAERIVHVPEMLYRWRIHGGSAGHEMIGRVMETSRTILQRHLHRCGEEGMVTDGPSFNFFDVRYPLDPALKVAILIPTKNHGELVRACIESIERTAGDVRHEIVLIDHESDDPASLAYFDSLRSRITLLRYSGPFNFAAINNWAVGQLDGSHTHYLFCNNDIEAIESGWLGRMLELGQKPGVGIVGAKLYYPDRKTIQHAGVVVACCGVAENLGRFRVVSDDPLDLGYSGSLICNREVSAVTAACMLIRGTVFESIGGFDEAIAVGYGDVDLCLRVGRQGYRTLFCAHAELLHLESFTRGRSQEDPHPEDSARFLAKWKVLFETGDPYFNPNLSSHSPNWQVADPLGFRLDIRRRIFQREPGSDSNPQWQE
jgi:GT2 family glycosyltransferase/glycosyltransferase involved in cell wall biosynthesis